METTPMKIRKVCFSLLVLLVALAIQPFTAIAQQASHPSNKGFSFVVYGDSRSMMYLPYKQDQEAEARKLMVDMFELVLPAKVAPEVVAKDVKLIYDPKTKELVEMVMPFDTASEVTTLKFDKGWVTEASVEDTKLLPGVSRQMYRLEGGDWVAKEVVRDIKDGRAKFLVSTGDLGLVGQAGRQALRQSVLEAGERRSAEATAASGQGNEGRGAAGARISRRGESRSVGRLRRRRTAGVLSLPDEIRRI